MPRLIQSIITITRAPLPERIIHQVANENSGEQNCGTSAHFWKQISLDTSPTV
ncbi:unnamed protein product [Photorhabdus laumondii subsp. laumondii TTO1]|uniref:Photorhabdus luminescens subsp. laumondii TTO1 complete genome segment 7/17 n=1 Tax=Photorhabdus laumondii subsp. laumondii (strain DSM 15139 / CIP 105565 / TT01) TaxID=243265 RepID=Q7N5S7_PHOLL|nr:unnamed protein product [Photorhabdus laumondii subsp. laumondii TTO1]